MNNKSISFLTDYFEFELNLTALKIFWVFVNSYEKANLHMKSKLLTDREYAIPRNVGGATEKENELYKKERFCIG